jgi:large subunit ribosomal protein L24
MSKIRKGDEVVVTTGKDKGRRGTVSAVLENRVIVENLNMVKRHTRPNPQRNVPGGIVAKEASIHVSNVMLWNAKANKGDRVGFKVEGDKKVRYFKSNNEVVDR